MKRFFIHFVCNTLRANDFLCAYFLRKKFIRAGVSRAHVDQDHGMKAAHWLEVRVQLRNHHKLNSSAKSLEMPRVQLLGHLVSLWLGVLEFAEDGDLWRENEEKTLRFIASLAELPSGPERFVEVLRLDGWLIHDWLDYAGKYLWLDYAGKYLYAKYKSHNKNKLMGIWAKHGRRYGEDRDAVGMQVGCERDAVRAYPYTLTITLYLKPLPRQP